jgi:hypothetical protein
MRRVTNPNYVTFSPTETVVTLKENRGQLRTNGMGEFFLRSFADGRFTCTSPDLERQLIDLGVCAGMTVGITRAKYGQSVIWKVRRVGETVEMPREHKTYPKQLAKSSSSFPEEKYATPVPPAPALPECDRTAEVIKHQEPRSMAPSLIIRCLRAAIDAAADAEAHGENIGFGCKLGAGEIQAIAVTLYIQANKNLEKSGHQSMRKPNDSAVGYVNGQGTTEAHR